MRLEQNEVVNKGNTYDDIGAKQKRRKLSQFHRAADAALWCGESFGLVPTQLTECTSKKDDSISIPLGATSTPLPDTHIAREVDEFFAMQTLYLLDRFGDSDEFYSSMYFFY